MMVLGFFFYLGLETFWGFLSTGRSSNLKVNLVFFFSLPLLHLSRLQTFHLPSSSPSCPPALCLCRTVLKGRVPNILSHILHVPFFFPSFHNPPFPFTLCLSF